LTAALTSPDSWDSAFPLANLKDPQLSHTARTVNATGTKTINIDLGGTRDIRCLSLMGHNLTLAATVRVRGYSDSTYTEPLSTPAVAASGGTTQTFTFSKAGATQYQVWAGSTLGGFDYASSGVVAGPTFALTSLPVDGRRIYITLCSYVSSVWVFNYYSYKATGAGADMSIDSGTVSPWPSTFTAQNVIDYPKNWTFAFSSLKTARYWKIEILDAANPDGYIKLGRCWIGEAAYEPAVGISDGLSLGYASNDVIDYSLGRVRYGKKVVAERSLIAKFDTLTEDEGNAALVMQKVLTETDEVLWISNGADTAKNMLLRAFPAFLSKPSPLVYPYFNNFELPIQVIERI
jgi:hypothetical protein